MAHGKLRWRRLAPANLGVVAIAFGLMLMATGLAGPAGAAERELAVELNKVEDLDGGCTGTLLFQNSLGATLDRFNLDLFLFDASGVIMRRITIDMAPLRNGKTSVGLFRLIDGSCADLSRILVNDIPSCRAEDGSEVDCLAGLSVSSRSAVELIK